MPSIYETLKKDHDTHRELLAQLAETTGDSSRRRELWKQFYYDVGGHAAAEEETFYSPLMEKEDGQPKGRHSVAEHKELDDIIQELDEMDMSSPGWMTRFKTLRHDYEHHIDEEEEEIFPVAKKVIGKDEDGAISQSFLKRKARER
ncbi:hemerythrin domain-containing protein, partial [Hyphomonas atlantica]|uniref:hemerythrin domain-containing protein n=1 Tax=Hyphomonas atlantica TaxID=1280948 RepID=UPI0032B1370E